MVWRIPVNEAVVAEEARSLADGSRVLAESGYVHTDPRGSTLAARSVAGSDWSTSAAR
jgi:hypothetical protein